MGWRGATGGGGGDAGAGTKSTEGWGAGGPEVTPGGGGNVASSFEAGAGAGGWSGVGGCGRPLLGEGSAGASCAAGLEGLRLKIGSPEKKDLRGASG